MLKYSGEHYFVKNTDLKYAATEDFLQKGEQFSTNSDDRNDQKGYNENHKFSGLNIMAPGKGRQYDTIECQQSKKEIPVMDQIKIGEFIARKRKERELTQMLGGVHCLTLSGLVKPIKSSSSRLCCFHQASSNCIVFVANGV